MELWVVGLLAAIIVGGIAHLRHLPIALPLVATGFLLFLIAGHGEDPASHAEILPIVLAPLVFGTALNMPYLDVRKATGVVLALAVGLVTVTTLGIGLISSSLVPTLPFAAACALGAILAPTDAVAVQSVGRSGAVPRQLVQVLEAESLVNDGTALTALRVAVVAAVAGSVTPLQVGETLLLSVVGGVAIGALTGFLTARALHRTVDPVVGGGLLLAVPFLTYFGAEHLHGSGLLALVVAGVWISQEMAAKHDHHIRLQSSALYGPVNFVLESVAFLLIGFELPRAIRADIGELDLVLLLTLVLTFALLALRLGYVALLNLIGRSSTLYSGHPWRSAMIVAWAGTRGPISVLAGFSIPFVTDAGEPFPHRNLLIAVTLCCVLVSILLSLTFGPVARWLQLPPNDDERAMNMARIRMAKAALSYLDEAVAVADRDGRPLSEDVVGPVRDTIVDRIEHYNEQLGVDQADAAPREMHTLVRATIEAEREVLEQMRTSGELEEALARELLAGLDRRASALA